MVSLFPFPRSTPGRPLAFWLQLFVLAACTAIVGVEGWRELRSYETTLAHAEDDARRLAVSLAQHAEDTFEMVDLALTALARSLRESAGTPEELQAIGRGLAEQVRRSPRLRGLFYYDETGAWRAASTSLVPAGAGFSDRDYFRHHARNRGEGLRIGRPVQSRPGGQWIVTASRRFNKPDGSFGGVLLGTVDVAYFANFYRAFAGGADGGIALFGNDGVLYARYPVLEDQIGREYLRQGWSAIAQSEREGTFRLLSPLDGVERVHGYQSSDRFPVSVVVGVGKEEALAGWWRQFLAQMSGIVALSGLLAVCGLQLAAHARRRQVAEEELSRLAATDALTGIMNRRMFDEVLQAQWREAARTGRPLSLLLIDVDHFKAFNDSYGHPAGDTCLQIIAAVIAQAARHPGDRAARYGGEEFAVILPDTGVDDALVVAERIRSAILALCIRHAASAIDHISASVGCTTATGAEFSRHRDPMPLVLDADRALYKAKLLGRNCVAISAPSLVRSA